MTVTAIVLISAQTAYDIARRMRRLTTIPLTSPKWRAFLRSEHSPIRVATYQVDMIGIPAWVSVHFSRHKIGVEHFVTSNREDITGKTRTADATVDHIMVINAQALITMARKRLCYKASDETRETMEAVWDAIRAIDQTLAATMAPDCIYRGRCNEFSPCGLKGTNR
jgi:hypothetical protein